MADQLKNGSQEQYLPRQHYTYPNNIMIWDALRLNLHSPRRDLEQGFLKSVIAMYLATSFCFILHKDSNGCLDFLLMK
jgi:hypothetical protein